MSLTSRQYAALVDGSYVRPDKLGVKSPVVSIDGDRYQRLEYMDRSSGYQGIIYQKLDTGEMIVAHRGTEFERQPLQDGLYADGGMVFARHNAQVADAIEVTQRAVDLAERQAKRDGRKPEVTVTGHSLGGDLAQVTAHHFGLKGHIFNAYGAVSLDRRIPDGGNAVVNHIMAGDAVSAASRHYGQMKVYATPNEVTMLEKAGYANDRSRLDARNPFSVAVGLDDSHRMHHFLPVDGNGKPDRSVLEDPVTQQLARQYVPMIEKYRDDVETMRAGLTLYSRGVLGLARDGVDHLRGLVEPEAGCREMDAPSWQQQVQQFQHDRERSYTPQGWQVPLKVDAEDAHAVSQTQTGRPPPLQDDPGAFLDRMLAAAQSGDRDRFREMTQTLANEAPGRALRAEAIETVNQQEQQAAQQAMQAQRQQAELQQQQAELQQQQAMRVGAHSL